MEAKTPTFDIQSTMYKHKQLLLKKKNFISSIRVTRDIAEYYVVYGNNCCIRFGDKKIKIYIWIGLFYQ